MIYINHKKLYGVTMIEMLLVIVLIAVLTLLAVQRMNKYTMDSNVQAIAGSVKSLFDLMNRYYYSECEALNRSSGSAIDLSENDFVNAGITTNDQYNALVKNPFGADVSSTYSYSLTYQTVSVNNSVSGVNVPGAYWRAQVTFYLPSNFNNEVAVIYAAKLKPNTTAQNNHQLIWYQTIGSRIQGVGSTFSPLAESLSRFAIQQYVPVNDSLPASSASELTKNQSPVYDQDYTSDYRPSGSQDSCEVIEESYLNNQAFEQKRAIH